ncbi:hypothetical protein AXG93_3786s1000 [Marchantia polymorpha subsp. ruderalis]|uniref:Uncharacterized protein n=1 Tax=Marchantia polymorpha subsp. ruderalis TaxID=1480154 RepID=A0A176W0Z8_MARPO|nr:hypothetical protein AXG93_3786s1000 [Marchantia polymorpha subsp. ruderalis]
MEDAVASNVSHAAETRGIDSADGNPEILSAVQDLLWRLEGRAESFRRDNLSWKEFLRLEERDELIRRVSLSGPEFQAYFPSSVSLSTIMGGEANCDFECWRQLAAAIPLSFLTWKRIRHCEVGSGLVAAGDDGNRSS